MNGETEVKDIGDFYRIVLDIVSPLRFGQQAPHSAAPKGNDIRYLVDGNPNIGWGSGVQDVSSTQRVATITIRN